MCILLLGYINLPCSSTVACPISLWEEATPLIVWVLLIYSMLTAVARIYTSIFINLNIWVVFAICLIKCFQIAMLSRTNYSFSCRACFQKIYWRHKKVKNFEIYLNVQNLSYFKSYISSIGQAVFSVSSKIKRANSCIKHRLWHMLQNYEKKSTNRNYLHLFIFTGLRESNI